MSRTTAFDHLLAQVWKQAISSLLNNLREEHVPTLTSAWVVSILLKVGLSSEEPEIRDYLALLDNWVERLEVRAEVIDESSTGLLGLCIYLCGQRGRRVGNHLESLFLRSVEHNLEKPKDLSLGTSVDLLVAVAAGLRSSSPPAELQTRMCERLQALVTNADAIAMIQLLQAWELIQRIGEIPYMDMQHKFEAIAVDENKTHLERAMAYYGQFFIRRISGTSKIEHELRFLDCLGIAASSNHNESVSMVKTYVLSLPYLRERMSFGSLFDAWQRYATSSFKRAKTENYWTRYLFVVCLVVLALVLCWSWLRQLNSGLQISIGTAVVTTLLMLTTFTIEVTAELHGRQFWQKGKVEIFILFLGAVISVGAALAEALLK